MVPTLNFQSLTIPDLSLTESNTDEHLHEEGRVSHGDEEEVGEDDRGSPNPPPPPGGQPNNPHPVLTSGPTTTTNFSSGEALSWDFLGGKPQQQSNGVMVHQYHNPQEIVEEDNPRTGKDNVVASLVTKECREM